MISGKDTAEEFIEKLNFFIIIVSLIVSERLKVKTGLMEDTFAFQKTFFL